MSAPKNELNHFDSQGNATMVDVGSKPLTRRRALARGSLKISAELAQRLAQGDNAKGDAFSVAKTAGILAAKRTGELIPLCHPLGLDHVGIQLELDLNENRVWIEAEASTTAKTGVEMEAMTAASVAALTFYDMVKGMDKTVLIERVGLYQKEGGKSGFFENPLLRRKPRPL